MIFNEDIYLTLVLKSVKLTGLNIDAFCILITTPVTS